jgi:hypothetical protein
MADADVVDVQVELARDPIGNELRKHPVMSARLA